MAACVFARKAEWLRNACLAAALLFPAVAAIHGIVLTALHVDGAADMDVYGAFQFCSIGILAAPVTVKLSRTYFNDPGRNIIFAWTTLLLAGLLSLTVEFYRIHSVDCLANPGNNQHPIDPNGRFPYGNTTCGLTCSESDGPFSLMRHGATSEIFVVPEPHYLDFNTATLLAAASCIPAILSLISMWNKILEINWKTRFGNREEDEDPIEGTNGATVGRMKGVNNSISGFLKSAVEVPVFCAAVLAIVIAGERNFWSDQMFYETEPVSSIGQWAPLVGTGFAVIGSLYILVAVDAEAAKEEENSNTSMHHHCNCSRDHSHHNEERRFSQLQLAADHLPVARGYRNTHEDCDSPTHAPESPSTQEGRPTLFRTTSRSIASPVDSDMQHSITNGDEELGLAHITSGPTSTIREQQPKRSMTDDVGNRRKVATALNVLGNYLGTASRDQFDDSEFKLGKAQDFPEIPGEENRNRALHHIREVYNVPRDEDGNVTPAPRRQTSRAPSVMSLHEGSKSRAVSPSPGSPQSPPSPSLFRASRASTLPTRRTSSDLHNPASPSGGLTRGRPRLSHDTLEVPSLVHLSASRGNPSLVSVSPISTVCGGESPPAIVVSDPDITPSPQTAIINTPSPPQSVGP